MSEQYFNPNAMSTESTGTPVARVDSTQVTKPKQVDKSMTKEGGILQMGSTTTPKPATTTTTPVAKKPAAKKPDPPKEQFVTSTNSTNDAQQTIGSFKTNIPGFNELNFENKKATQVINGVGVYVTGDNNDVETQIIENGPPTRISLKSKGSDILHVTIPDQGEPPVKGSIVCDENGNFVFNNMEIDDISLYSHNGNEKILINGGHVKNLDTAERKHGNDDSQLLNNGQTQYIVLKDTKVDKASIGNDKILMKNSNITDITTVSRGKSGYNGEIKSYIYGAETENNLSLQSGLGEEQFFLQSGAKKEEIGKLVMNDFQHGTVNVQDEHFSGVNMKDVSVARTLGNLHLYNKAEDGTQLNVNETQDGYSILLPGNTVFEIPKDQPEGARIFYDKETNSLYMNNITGLKYNPGSEYQTSTNVFLDNVEINEFYTVEFHDGGHGTAATRGKQYGGGWQTKTPTLEYLDEAREHTSNIAFVNNTRVKDENSQIATYADNVYVDNQSAENIKNNYDSIASKTYGEQGEIELGSELVYKNWLKANTHEIHLDNKKANTLLGKTVYSTFFRSEH